MRVTVAMTTKGALDLHQDSIKSLIFKMTLPVMLAGFVTTSYGFIDMIFASRLGIVEVASIAFVTPLFMMLQALSMGVIRGGISIIATLLGQQDANQACAYATQLRFLIILLSLLFSIPGFFFVPHILNATGVSAELYVQSVTYSRILFLSIPVTLLFQLYGSFFKSQGKMKVISSISIFGVCCNALMNALFIYSADFKIDGLAYATLVTAFLQACIIIYLFKRDEQDVKVMWSTQPFYSKWLVWKKLLVVGMPLAISQASSQFGFLVLNIFIVQYGHQAVAAFAIGNRIHSLLFSPAKEIGNALVPLLAQNWGRGAIDRVKETIKLGIIFAVCFGVLAGIVIQVIKYPITHFLTQDDPLVYQHVINYVSLVGWTVIAWAIFHTLQGIFNSFQKTMFTLMINLFRLWGIRIPGTFMFFYFMPSVAEYGIWYTMFFSNALTVIFAIGYFMMTIPFMLQQATEKHALRLVNEQKVLI